MGARRAVWKVQREETEGWFVELLNFKTGVDFGANGNLNEFSPVGSSLPPDVVSTWSEAAVAELTFRLPPLRHDVRFVIEVFWGMICAFSASVS
jgi:hypothetical protein